ncbi:unnamed protein product, partial [Sphacelaria rigidula]
MYVLYLQCDVKRSAACMLHYSMLYRGASAIRSMHMMVSVYMHNIGGRLIIVPRTRACIRTPRMSSPRDVATMKEVGAQVSTNEKYIIFTRKAVCMGLYP